MKYLLRRYGLIWVLLCSVSLPCVQASGGGDVIRFIPKEKRKSNQYVSLELKKSDVVGMPLQSIGQRLYSKMLYSDSSCTLAFFNYDKIKFYKKRGEDQDNEDDEKQIEYELDKDFEFLEKTEVYETYSIVELIFSWGYGTDKSFGVNDLDDVTDKKIYVEFVLNDDDVITEGGDELMYKVSFVNYFFKKKDGSDIPADNPQHSMIKSLVWKVFSHNIVLILMIMGLYLIFQHKQIFVRERKAMRSQRRKVLRKGDLPVRATGTYEENVPFLRDIEPCLDTATIPTVCPEWDAYGDNSEGVRGDHGQGRPNGWVMFWLLVMLSLFGMMLGLVRRGFEVSGIND